jgi:integrase
MKSMNMTLRPRAGDGTLYVHFTDGNGRRRRISTGTTEEKVAEIKAYDILREHLVDAVPVEQRDQVVYLDTLASALRDTYESHWRQTENAKGMRHLCAKIGREVGHWPLRTITTDRIRDYVTGMGKKPGTMNSYVSAIRTAMTRAREKDKSLVLPEFPYFTNTARKERFVSNEEEARILAHIQSRVCDHEPVWGYMALVFPVLIETGMRISEVLKLRREDLRLSVGRLSLWLPHGVETLEDGTKRRTKTGKGRLVPLVKRVQPMVEALFNHPMHGKVTAVKAGQTWRRAVNALGLRDITLHTMRHTTASRLVQSGVNLYEAASWLGHSHTEMTERYAHLAPSYLSSAIEAMEQRRWETGSTDQWNPLAGLDIDPALARQIVEKFLSERAAEATSSA